MWRTLLGSKEKNPEEERLETLEEVKTMGWILENKKQFQDDREIVFEAVKQNGRSLRFASTNLQNDREIVLAAVKNYGRALKFASFDMASDDEIVREAVKQNGRALKHVKSQLRHDREFTLQAVKNNGLALKYSRFHDREMEWEAVNQNSWALEHVNSMDKEISLLAVRKNGLALRYAVHDTEIILEAVKQNAQAVQYIKNMLNKSLCVKIVSQSGLALEYLNENFRKDREIALAAMSQNFAAFQFVSNDMKNDRNFIIEALMNDDESFKREMAKQDNILFQQVDSVYKKDREIILLSVKSGMKFEGIDALLKKDREIVLEAIKQDSGAFPLIDASLRKDKDFVLQAIRGNGLVLEFLSDELKKDKQIVSTAVEQNINALKFADRSLNSDFLFVYNVWKKSPTVNHAFDHELFKIIKRSSSRDVHFKLSKDYLERYSKLFSEENYLFFYVQFEIDPPKTIRALFNASYSNQFVEKMVILEIMRCLIDREPTVDVCDSPTIGYYLFCLRLNKFLDETRIKTTNFKDLKKTVQSIVEKFNTSIYNKKEIGYILYFFKEWTNDDESFENYKQILSKYNELRGDFSKIVRALNQYYEYFKEQYDFISVLGYGGEGAAFKALDKQTGIMVAIKMKFDMELDEEGSLERIKFLKRNDMEGKIKCYDCGLIGNYMYSVMELGEDSLSDFISSHADNYQNMDQDFLIEILKIYIKILDSVQSIHNHNISHRDLDPNNIVKVKNQYKIIDFETSKVIEVGKSITITRGKFAYMSPEVSNENYDEELLKDGDQDKLAQNFGNITTSCDLFSLGCIFLRLLTNCPLQLDQNFIYDSNISKYGPNHPYFTNYGKYFYTVLTTSEGEMKLHHAIQRLITRVINPEFGVNEILVRCLITMIQRDASKRLDCFTHKTTLSHVVKYLNCDCNNIDLDIQIYKSIDQLKSYSQIVDERNELADNNKKLLKKIKELEEENRKLKN